MGNSADRLSGVFFLLFGLGMYFVVNPNYIEAVSGGNIAPKSLPNIVSIVIAVCGAILAIKPTTYQMRNPVLMAKAGLYAVLLALGIYAMSLVGFEYVAPVLAFAIMWLIGERRPFWLVFGTIGMPLLIWFLVTQALERALP